MNMIYAVLLVLVAIALTGLVVGIAKDDYKWRAVADASNMAIMLILLVINMVQGNPVWCFICAIFLVFDFSSFSYNITKYGETKKNNEKANSLDNTKSVLKEFIKEIEEYGSRRH